jgi:hypothetical protein
MLDGNTVRVDQDDSREHAITKRATPPVPVAARSNDKIARAIAEGLMVLPHDNGVPPVLRRRGSTQVAPLPELPRHEVEPDITMKPVLAKPEPGARLAHIAPVEQGVTPLPAGFRSQATPLPVKPATQAVRGQPVNTAPYLTAVETPAPDRDEKTGRHAIEQAPVQVALQIVEPAIEYAANEMPPVVEPSGRAQAHPPSIQTVRDHIPQPPTQPEIQQEFVHPVQTAAQTASAPQPAASKPSADVAAPQPHAAPQQQPHVAPPVQPQAPQYKQQQQYYQQPQAPQAFQYPYAGPAYGQPAQQGYYGAGFHPAAQQPPHLQGYYSPQHPQHYCAPQGQYPHQQTAYPQHPALNGQRNTGAFVSPEVADAAQLMSGLLQYLPKAGQFWSEPERENWLDAAATLFDLAYGDVGHSDRRIKSRRDR